MKFAKLSKSVVMGSALLLASSAFAGTKASLTLSSPTVVKNVVAKVPAKLVGLSSPAQRDAAVVNQAENGSRTLSGARFEGKKYALEIGESSMGLQAGSSK